jgi:hypothetical protein
MPVIILQCAIAITRYFPNRKLVFLHLLQLQQNSKPGRRFDIGRVPNYSATSTPRNGQQQHGGRSGVEVNNVHALRIISAADGGFSSSS